MDQPQESMFSAEDSRAKTSPWLATVLDWLGSGADYSGSSCASLVRSLPVGFSSRTSLAFSPRVTSPDAPSPSAQAATPERIWQRSRGPWPRPRSGGLCDQAAQHRVQPGREVL